MLLVGAQPPQFPKLAAGESSPTSPDNFRQLDDVFLQTQTRVWLGEVLRSRLNDERSLADLLADGELLFEVSKEVWNMVLSTRPELKPYEYEPFASRNSGRYMPYSFVDSFLRMCKILGLDGIDLFSPSDVVEKGDTRKVCVCLRALSKKARSLDLDVPDFDIVTSTIVMPTDMVGHIRRSWELSLSEYSSSSRLSQFQKLKQRPSQESLDEEYSRREFGDSETSSVLQSDTSTTNYDYHKSLSYFRSKSKKPDNDCLDLCSQTQVGDESREIEGSSFLHSLDDDNNQEENVVSSPILDSNGTSGGSFLNVESGSVDSSKSNSIEHIYHNLNLEDKTSAVEYSSTNSCITDTGDSGSCWPEKTSDGNECTSQVLDGDDAEVSSVGSVNSMAIHARNIDFDDESEVESFPETSGKFDGMSAKEESLDTGLYSHKCSIASSGNDTAGNIDPVIQYDNVKPGDEGKESNAAVPWFSHGIPQWDQKGKCQVAVVPTGNVGSEVLSQSPPLLDSCQYVEGEVIGDKITSTVADNDVDKEINPDSSLKDLNVVCETGNPEKDEEAVQKLQKQTGYHTMGIVKSKPQKGRILKAVVSGTAVIAATFLFLNFRKNEREKSGEVGKKSNGVRIINGRNTLSGKEQKARKVDGVYPAEKLKL